MKDEHVKDAAQEVAEDVFGGAAMIAHIACYRLRDNRAPAAVPTAASAVPPTANQPC